MKSAFRYFSYTLFFLCLYTISSSAQNAQQLRAKGYAQKAIEYRSQKKYDKAISYYIKAKKLVEDQKDSSEIIKYTELIGAVFYVKRAYKEAASYILEAVELIKQDEEIDSIALSNNYQLLGHTYLKLIDYSKALLFYEKALEIREQDELNKQEALAETYNFIGIVHRRLGDYNKALVFFQKTLALRKKILPKLHKDLAWIYIDIGNICRKQNKLTEALAYYYKALTIREALYSEEHAVVASTYNQIGQLYLKQEALDEALNNLQKGLSIREKVLPENHIGIAWSYNYIGLTYRALKDYDQALFFLQKALAIRLLQLPDNHPDLAWSYNNIGYVYHSKNEYEKALEYYEKTARIWEATLSETHPDKITLYIQFGEIKYQQKKYEEAQAYVRKALIKQDNRKGFVSFYSQLLARHLEAKIALAQYNENKNDLYLKKAYQNVGLMNKLIKEIRLHNTDTDDRLRFSETAHQIYETSIQISALLYDKDREEKYVLEILEFMEESKTITLQESMNEVEALKYAGIPDSILAKEKEYKIASSTYEELLYKAEERNDTIGIKRYRQKYFEQQTAYRTLIDQLEKDYPKYYDLKYKKNTVDIRDIQAYLDEETALVEYFEGKQQLYIVCLTRSSVQFFASNKIEKWDRVLNDFRKSTSNKDFVFDEKNTKQVFDLYTTTSHILYKELLKNVEENLPQQIKRLVVIPDGQLNLVPFELLLTQSSTDLNAYKKLSYLMNDYSIAYAYCANLLVHKKEGTVNSANENYGGFAPKYSPTQELNLSKEGSLTKIDNSSLLDLPAARNSVDQIATLLDGNSFISEEANTSTFLKNAEKFRVLHLAMHALINDKNPLFSKFVFSSTEKTNHYLTASDLYNMELNAELAVLNACNTGIGKIRKGEGVMSLSRAFVYAGCPSLVMSLWSIPDVQSSKIIIDFFKELKQGNRKDDALRQAKLNYLLHTAPSTAHPIYWSGFICSGDVEAIEFFSKSNRFWILFLLTFFIGIFFFFRRN